MNGGTTHDAWRAEREETDRLCKEDPSLLTRESLLDPDFLHARVGIVGLDAGRPKGYLRYLPQDFIVEEVCENGEIVSVNPTRSVPDEGTGDHRTLLVNLIKVHLSTPNAIAQIATHLSIPETAIGYAGLKDAAAVTAQRLSLRDIEWPRVAQTKIPNIFLEPVTYGNRALERGGLKGNQFTIFVRTDAHESSERLRFLIEAYNRLGFANYFGLQRFGSRLEGHKVGCLMARGDVDGALRVFFTEIGPTDLPLFRQIRMKLAGCYGEWREMRKFIEPLPYTFSREIAVLDRLIAEPTKTINAWRDVQDAVRLMVNGYASWVVNRYLSKVQKAGDTIPDEIPLPLSASAEDRTFFVDFLSQDGVNDPMNALRYFPFLNIKPRKIPGRIFPHVHRVTKIDEGVAFALTLPKEANSATTYLMHLYRLYEGAPVPGWVKTTEVDTKRVVRMGDMDGIKKMFGKFESEAGASLDPTSYHSA